MADIKTEREQIAAYLEARAAFWDAYPAHAHTARALRNEAVAVRTGEFKPKRTER